MGQGSSGNVISALASFFLPGLGQLIQGRFFWAAFFFIGCAVLYGLVFTWPVAVVMHIWAILNAALFNPAKDD